MRTLKPLVFLICLLPLARAVWMVASGAAVNPIEFALRSTGTWTLTGLLIVLALTPLRQIFGWHGLIRYRRMLGLFAFFYAALHFTVWFALDRFFNWTGILKDLTQRPFIIAGFLALLILLALAATSTEGWMRRLKRNWGRLHKLVYLAAPLGVLHYAWLVKRDLTLPAIYAAILAFLLLWRATRWLPSVYPGRHHDK